MSEVVYAAGGTLHPLIPSYVKALPCVAREAAAEGSVQSHAQRSSHSYWRQRLIWRGFVAAQYNSHPLLEHRGMCSSSG